MNNSITQFLQYDDAALIEKITGGDSALYEVLIRRYNPYLYKTARSYGYNHHDAEDLMQETYIAAYKGLSKFENRSSLKTWLIKIMLRKCYRKQQKFSYKNEVNMGDNVKENSNAMFSNPSDTTKMILNKELSHVLESALQKVPDDYRLVFAMRELNGLSVQETAQALDITESNVKVRLNRAKTMMRHEVEKIYTPDEIYEFNLVYCDRIVERVLNELQNLQIV